MNRQVMNVMTEDAGNKILLLQVKYRLGLVSNYQVLILTKRITDISPKKINKKNHILSD